MAIQSMHDLAAALAGSKKLTVSKAGLAGAAGRIVPLFAVAGQPSIGIIPGTGGAVCTDADAAAPTFTNPSGGDTGYLGGLQLSAGATGGLLLFDRLVHNGGFSANVNTLQAMTTPAITRPDATGEGAELWVHVYTAGGATTSTLTIKYTNSAGVTNRTATIAAKAWNAVEMVIAPLQDGDTGVKSVESIQFGTATGTVGSVGVVIQRRLAVVPFTVANVPVTMDALQLALPVIHPDAHISMAWLATATAAVPVLGTLELIQG